MARSFSLVDQKMAEADFFLKKLKEADFDFFAALKLIDNILDTQG